MSRSKRLGQTVPSTRTQASTYVWEPLAPESPDSSIYAKYISKVRIIRAAGRRWVLPRAAQDGPASALLTGGQRFEVAELGRQTVVIFLSRERDDQRRALIVGHKNDAVFACFRQPNR